MLEEILKYINNWFDKDKSGNYWGAYSGDWKVENLSIDLSEYLVLGQYYRIEGSRFNDGVFCYGDPLIADEDFNGIIYEMRIPPDFFNLVTEIQTWKDKYGESATSPYTSESFAGYSYQKAGLGTADAASWQTAFKARLRPWRKI